MMRFSSYGVAISEPSEAKMRDCSDSGFWVNSPGSASKMLTPLRAAAPVAATVGIISPAPSKPRTTEVATRAPSRLMIFAKFARRSGMGQG